MFSKSWRGLVLGLIAGALAWTAAPSAQAARPTLYEGLEMGFTAEGHPYVGSAAAPLVLEEWSDYLCPFCRRHFERTVPELIGRYVRPGQMRIVFRDFPIAALHPTAEWGHAAARCAGEQSPEAYWALHDALFARQPQWSGLAEPREFLVELARGLELDSERLATCLADSAALERIGESVAEGQGHGVSGTPGFRFISAGADTAHAIAGAQPIERFAAVAEALLAGNAPPEEPKPPPPELPFWAKPEGLAPDPRRPGYTVAGDAFKGNPAAPVVVVEFSDFQCPACRRHVLEVQPEIDARLVNTGRVRWVNKHLPLKSHPQAAIAAAAAECAGEQGLYWPMHDLLFEAVKDWAVEDAEAGLVALAPRAGLQDRAFRRCLAGRHALERVLADLYDAQGVVERVPRFVILSGGNSGSLTGPLATSQFIDLLRDELERLESRAPGVETPASP